MKTLCPQSQKGEKGKFLWQEFNRQSVLKNQRTTVVVFDGSVLCGFLQYEKTKEDSCFLGDVNIASRYQKDGVTTRLLFNEFIHDAEFKTCKTICTQIMDKNKASWSLAYHFGFKQGEKTSRGHKYYCERTVFDKMKIFKDSKFNS